MAITSFYMDPKMEQTFEELKKHYGATSKAQVFRKAIALLKVVQENEQSDGSILIRTTRNKYIKVLVR